MTARWAKHVPALLGLAACTPSTAERLQAAGAAPDLAAAFAACEGIGGEEGARCMVDQAERRGADAELCAQIGPPKWAGECRFRAAERLVRSGDAEAAMSLCVSTPFARECSYHLLRESARSVLAAPPATAAAALVPWLAVPSAHDAPKLFWKAYFRERRSDGGTADPTGCPDEACAQAARETFFEAARATFRADREGFCAAPPPTLSGWAATAETEAWLSTWAADACTRDAAPPQAIPAAP